jgi:hypothetical protein
MSQYEKLGNNELLSEYDKLKDTISSDKISRKADCDDDHDEFYDELYGSTYKEEGEEIEKIRSEILNRMNKK